MQGSLFAARNQVKQMHFGGGTPTYFPDEQIDDLMAHLHRWFKFFTAYLNKPFSRYNRHLPGSSRRTRILEADLPSSDTQLDILSLCIMRLTDPGYVYIGMDHFAKPTDDLVIAQQQGRLHRNFQGYSTPADTSLIACSASAIGAVGATYRQNCKTLDAYYVRLDRDELPIARGVRLSVDDLLLRFIIQMLMCNYELSIASIEQTYPIKFFGNSKQELEN